MIIYGLNESPRNYFEHLNANLLKLGLAHSEEDKCLVILDSVICLAY